MPSLAPRIDTLESTPTFSGQASFAAGSAAAPSLRFTVDPTTGLYRIGASNIGFACAGVAAGGINAGNWTLGLSGASGTKVSVNASSGAMPSISNSRTLSVYTDTNNFGIQSVNGFATYTGIMISAYAIRASSSAFNFISCVNGDGTSYNITNAFVVAGDGSITTAGGSSSTHNLNGLTQFNRSSATAFASGTFPPNPAAWFINATNSGTTSLVMQVRDVSAVAQYISLTTYSPGNALAALAFQATQTGTTKLLFTMESDPSAGGIGRARIGDSVYVGDNYRLMLTGQNVSVVKSAILQFGDNAEGISRQFAICNGRNATSQAGGKLYFIAANTGNADAMDGLGVNLGNINSGGDWEIGNSASSSNVHTIHGKISSIVNTGLTKLDLSTNSVNASIPTVKIKNENTANSTSVIAMEVTLGANGGAAGARFINFRDVDSEVGRIQLDSGTTSSFVGSSDARLKTDPKPIAGALDIVSRLEPYDFKWLAQGTRGHGFFAQEVYEIYPQVVAEGGEDVKQNPWGIDYSKLTPLLTAAIKELNAKIKELEARL